jgi:hypothetical protein
MHTYTQNELKYRVSYQSNVRNLPFSASFGQIYILNSEQHTVKTRE